MSRPDDLQETDAGGQAVEAVVRLASLTHGSRNNVRLGASGDDTSSIHLGDVDLHRGVVLGSDDAVGGRAT